MDRGVLLAACLLDGDVSAALTSFLTFIGFALINLLLLGQKSSNHPHPLQTLLFPD